MDYYYSVKVNFVMFRMVFLRRFFWWWALHNCLDPYLNSTIILFDTVQCVYARIIVLVTSRSTVMAYTV